MVEEAGLVCCCNLVQPETAIARITTAIDSTRLDMWAIVAKPSSRRNAAQYHSAPRARRGRQIRGSPPPRLVGEHGESDGLLGVGVDAVIGGNGDRGPRQQRREMRHDLGVVSAAARHDQVELAPVADGL